MLYDANVLDGRNRLAACQLANEEPHFETFEATADDALALAVGLKLQRRHLTKAQKAVLPLKLLPLDKEAARRLLGSRTDLHLSGDESPGGQAVDLAGARVGVSRNLVGRTRRIAEDAPEIFKAMQAGTLKTPREQTSPR